MEAINQDLCKQCGAPLVKSGPKLGRVEWLCSRHADERDPCYYRELRKASDDDQVACPNCGCQHVLSESEVRQTYDLPDRIRRRRVCRACGLSFHTREVLEA